VIVKTGSKEKTVTRLRPRCKREKNRETGEPEVPSLGKVLKKLGFEDNFWGGLGGGGVRNKKTELPEHEEKKQLTTTEKKKKKRGHGQRRMGGGRPTCEKQWKNQKGQTQRRDRNMERENINCQRDNEKKGKKLEGRQHKSITVGEKKPRGV